VRRVFILDPIQKAIDFQLRSLAGRLGEPPGQGGDIEAVLAEAADEKYSPKTKDWPLLQCYRAGFTFDEIASLFGLSYTDAKFRVHRAYIRESLRMAV